MNIDFIVDIENSKSYEKDTYSNLKEKGIDDSYEEIVFYSECYSAYRSHDYLATMLSTEEPVENASSSQFNYQRVSTPNGFKQGCKQIEPVEERIVTTDEQESYVGKKRYL